MPGKGGLFRALATCSVLGGEPRDCMCLVCAGRSRFSGRTHHNFEWPVVRTCRQEAQCLSVFAGVNTWVDTLRLTMSLESFDWVHLSGSQLLWPRGRDPAMCGYAKTAHRYLVSLHWSLTQFTPAGAN